MTSQTLEKPVEVQPVVIAAAVRETAPAAAKRLPVRPGSHRAFWVRLRNVVIGLFVAALVIGLGWYGLSKRHEPAAQSHENPSQEHSKDVDKVSVDVVTPAKGGIDRICIQPGTIEPFEAADLYSKVSGFLIEQTVDIGSRVKSGQVLAKIAVPEHEKQVDRDTARVQHAEAIVSQMKARIVGAEAEAKSAQSSIVVAKSQVKARSAYRNFREKQLARYRELNAQRAIDARVVDESEDQFEAALEAETAASEAVITAEQRLVVAKAKIDQGKADLDEAKAEVKVAAADLERSKVLVAYSVITSPYDGVITRRTFNRGDFIRSADVGGDRAPLLAVERTDVMRVIVQVPDRDVPYTNIGDMASIEVDALPGKPVKLPISRVAESEDAATRTMRTEIDLPNKDGRLRRGMYGRVTLVLEEGHQGSLTIPSTAITSKPDGNRAIVRVVRDGVVKFVPVIVGADNGIRVEVISGLTPADSVIVRANGVLEEGSAVDITGKKAAH